VVLGTDFGDRMRQSFVADVALSDEVTLEQWRKRSALEHVKEQFSRLWQYWL
jgi:cardiolipin synthase